MNHGAADIFILDARSYRSLTAGTYLGRQQMDWLKSELENSKAPFKVIMNSIPITDFSSLIGPIERENRYDLYSIE